MKRFIPIICILLLGKFSLLSQEPYKINFTTENGLPSNEVYCAYQDTSGFMWFGTENGVSRYDGYTFQNFSLEDGLEQLEINQIIKDQNGKVWYSSFYGKVFFFYNNKFHPYPFNNILKKYKNRADLVNLRHIDEEGTFYFRVKYKGILLIDKVGREKLIQPDCGLCEVIYKTKSGFTITESYHNKNWPGYRKLRFEAIKLGLRALHIYEKGYDHPILFKLEEKINSNNSQALAWDKKTDLYTTNNQVYGIVDHKLIKLKRVNAPINYFYKEKNDIYIGLSNKGGLFIYRNCSPESKDIIPEKWLQGTEISYIIRDKNQGLWVTSINEGIFYFPNDQIKVFKNNYSQKSQKITALYPLSKGSANGISFDGNLFSVNDRNLAWNLVIKDCSNPHDILNHGGKLYFKSHIIIPPKKIEVNRVC